MVLHFLACEAECGNHRDFSISLMVSEIHNRRLVGSSPIRKQRFPWLFAHFQSARDARVTLRLIRFPSHLVPKRHPVPTPKIAGHPSPGQMPHSRYKRVAHLSCADHRFLAVWRQENAGVGPWYWRGHERVQKSLSRYSGLSTTNSSSSRAN